MISGYPKDVTLRDGTAVRLRPMEAADAPALLTFFRALPEEDRAFLKDDVTQQEIIDRWVRELDYERVLPMLAFDGKRVVGDATLHRQRQGWSRHVGEIRCVVARKFRKKGLGTTLIGELYRNAVGMGLDRIVAQMMESQTGAIAAFEKLGFQREAVLKGHVRDIHGKKHSLVVMSNDITELWHRMDDLLHFGDMPRLSGFSPE